MIIVLSDLVQDDNQFDFKHDPAIRNETSAAFLASASARSSDLAFRGTPVFLGLVRSRDLGRLSPRRRVAIGIFWLEFLKASGANPVLAGMDLAYFQDSLS